MFKTVILNTGAQIAGKVITASTTLLVTILIGNALGEAGYGEFTKIFVYVGYFYILADFGLNSIYIKISQSSDVTQPPLILLRSLLGLRLLLGISLAAIAIFISLFLPYNPHAGTGFSPLVKTGIIIASLTILTQALFTTANAYFQKILRYDLSTIAAISGSLIILVCVYTATLANVGLLGYVGSYVVGGIVFVLTASLLITKRIKQFILPTFSTKDFQVLLKKAWPIGVALIVNLIYFRIDVFILANTRTSVEVGLYGLAYQFFEATLAIPIFFANTLYPLLAKLYIKNIQEFKLQVRSWIKLLSLFSILLLVALSVVAYLIPFIFQGRFAGSTPALQILALGLPFFFISALLWHVLIIYDQQKYLIYIYSAGAIFNLISNLIFIPIYGYLAAATVTVISEALITLLLLLTIIKILQFATN